MVSGLICVLSVRAQGISIPSTNSAGKDVIDKRNRQIYLGRFSVLKSLPLKNIPMLVQNTTIKSQHNSNKHDISGDINNKTSVAMFSKAFVANCSYSTEFDPHEVPEGKAGIRLFSPRHGNIYIFCIMAYEPPWVI